jgi:hypothetical protein
VDSTALRIQSAVAGAVRVQSVGFETSDSVWVQAIPLFPERFGRTRNRLVGFQWVAGVADGATKDPPAAEAFVDSNSEF